MKENERTVRHIELQSTTIHSAGYNTEYWVLEIVFTSGDFYRYYKVPAYIFAELVTAKSAGEYFRNRIKGAFEYTKFTEENHDNL